MKNYKASVFLKRKDHYTKSMPHPKWWRRWLGQTVSYEIGWERVVYEFQAPQGALTADWFQEMIRKSLMQVSENSNVLVYDGSMMLEENGQATQYIATEGGIADCLNEVDNLREEVNRLRGEYGPKQDYSNAPSWDIKELDIIFAVREQEGTDYLYKSESGYHGFKDKLSEEDIDKGGFRLIWERGGE